MLFFSPRLAPKTKASITLLFVRISILFFTGTATVFFLLLFPGTICYSMSYGPLEPPTDVESYIESSVVTGTIITPTPLREDCREHSKTIRELQRGEQVRIVRDRSREWYFVISLGGLEKGWVKGESLSIPDDDEPVFTVLSPEQLSEYASTFGPESKTGYYVITDINRQKTYVFKGTQGHYTHIRTMACATGTNASPTITGDFKLSGRGEWFYSERLGSGGQFWIRFSGPYMFHSVAMDRDKNVTDPIVSVKRSSGCVRFTLEDAEWIYKNVPDGTPLTVK